MSLWDMLSVGAIPFLQIGAFLASARENIHALEVPNEIVGDASQKNIVKALAGISANARAVGAPVTAALAARLRKRYLKDRPTYGSASEESRNLAETIKIELRQRRFLIVPPHLAPYYESAGPPFGEEVATQFASATFDATEAHKCLALGRPTAAVFHLMRVAERGLAALAKALGVKFEREQWRVILDGIDKAVRQIEQEAKGEDKVRRQRVFSEAALELRLFKDAWRNHVVHGGAPYTEEDAARILGHVRAFMRGLATEVGE